MKKIIILVIGLLIVHFGKAMESDSIRADNPLIEYTRRIDFSNLQSPKFSYSGVSVRASFKGTSVSMILNDERNQNYYDIIIDNGIISKLK